MYVVIKYLHKYTTCVYVTGFHSVSNLRTKNSNYNEYRYTVGLVEPGDKHDPPLFVCDCSESMKAPFKEAELLPMLQKMLEDPVAAVEVKFSALGLICSLAQSGTAPGKILLHHKSRCADSVEGLHLNQDLLKQSSFFVE